MRRRTPTTRCRHASVEPIDTVDGIRVGAICTDCDDVLPAQWLDLKPGTLMMMNALIRLGYDGEDAVFFADLDDD